MKLVPLGDKIVLKQLEAEETTKSGIVLPGQAKEKPQEAEVIAVGPGGNIDGKEVVMQVKVGDKVIIPSMPEQMLSWMARNISSLSRMIFLQSLSKVHSEPEKS